MALRNVRWAAAALIIVLATVSIASAPAPATAARRTVLFEESTNWGCPPCYTANPTIHDFLEYYSVAQVVAVKWHVWWPASNDPFYNYNTAPVQSRIGYYGISAAPDVVVDGTNGPVPGSFGGMQSYVEDRLAIASPLAIEATGQVNGSNFDVSITVDVEQTQAAADYRLFCVLTEHHIHLASPNGETDHYDVFRETAALTGEPIDLSTLGSQQFDYSLPMGPTVPAEAAAVVWVQNYTTREVIQVATSWPKPQYYVRLAPDQPGVVNDPGTVAVLTCDVINLGTQSDTYDISAATDDLPPGWTYEYTTSQGTYSGPSTLPLAAGEGETITVEIDSNGNAGGGLVELTFDSQGDPAVTRTQRFSKLSNPEVIVYDDDGGADFELLLTRGLDAAGVGWGLWEEEWGKLDASELGTSPIVFWTCGLSYPTLDPTDRATLTAFLGAGGDLFVNGQDIGWELNTASSGNYDLTWYRNTLHATYQVDTAGYALTGEAGDPIGDGLSYSLSSANQPYPDGVGPYDGGEVSFSYNVTRKGVIRYDGGASRTVYMAHGFEGITDAATQDEIVARIIQWFASSTGVPGAEGTPGVIVSLDQNRPNPFNPSTQIPFATAAPGRVRLAVYDVAGRLVRELVDEQRLAGSYVATWNGRDAQGRPVASGTYYYRIEAPGLATQRAMVLVK